MSADSFIVNPFWSPKRYPPAKKSPAPVLSITLASVELKLYCFPSSRIRTPSAPRVQINCWTLGNSLSKYLIASVVIPV